MKKHLFVGFLVMGGVFLLPNISNATVLYNDQAHTVQSSQLSNNINAESGGIYEKFFIVNQSVSHTGIAVSWWANSVGVSASSTAEILCYSAGFIATSCTGDGDTATFNKSFVRSTDTVYVNTSVSQNRVSNFQFVGAPLSGTEWTMPASTTMRYKLIIYPKYSLNNYQYVYGNTASSTDNECVNNCGSIHSVALIIEDGYSTSGTGSGSSYPSISALSPARNTHTTSTDVAFSFNWSAGASFSISSWAIRYSDVSAGLGATPVVISGDISGTGGTVSKTITLTDGHLYTWSVTICDSSGSCYAQSDSVFGVGSASVGALDTYFGNPTVDVANGTTTDFLGIVPLFAKMANVVPFGYIPQIAQLWASSTNDISNSNGFPLVDIDLSSLGIGSGTPFANTGYRFTISTTTIMNLMTPTIYTLLMGMQTVAIWVGFAFYVYRRPFALVRPL